jgi:hypothetical protein
MKQTIMTNAAIDLTEDLTEGLTEDLTVLAELKKMW